MKFQMNRRRWIGLSLAGIAGAGALGTLFAAPALGGGGGWLGHGGGRWGHHGRHHFDEAEVRDHVEFLLRDANATDAQIDEIARIAASTAQELRGMREGVRGAHEQITAALGGESVDRASLEALRSEHLAAAETASRKLTDALAQVAEVLTPEQRKLLIAQHEKHRARHERE